MRRLVIDDLRTHVEGGTHVRTSQEAFEPLHHVWDEVWLDHDLGPDDDIMRVVDYMCEWAYFDHPVRVSVVYVHTQNPVGAENVMRALTRYGYNAKRVGVESFTA